MIEAHLNGVFPRPEELIQITRAAARGKASETEVDVLVRQKTQDLVTLQKAAGFQYVTDGQLSWQDLFRPFSTLLTGIEPSGVTRWFDNNTFYRKPIIKARPTYKGSDTQKYFHSDLLPSDTAKKAVLPGPVTFAMMSENRTTASLANLVDDLAHAIRDLVSELSSAGYAFFQFNEPILCSPNMKKGDLELAAKAFDILSNGMRGVKCLQTYFGDATGIMPTLLDFPVDYIGVDLYATPINRLREIDFSKGLGCGCLDGRNSLLESPHDLAKLISEIKDKISPRRLYACPSCDLEYLPYPVAEKKLQILSTVMKEG